MADSTTLLGQIYVEWDGQTAPATSCTTCSTTSARVHSWGFRQLVNTRTPRSQVDIAPDGETVPAEFVQDLLDDLRPETQLGIAASG